MNISKQSACNVTRLLSAIFVIFAANASTAWAIRVDYQFQGEFVIQATPIGDGIFRECVSGGKGGACDRPLWFNYSSGSFSAELDLDAETLHLTAEISGVVGTNEQGVIGTSTLHAELTYSELELEVDSLSGTLIGATAREHSSVNGLIQIDSAFPLPIGDGTQVSLHERFAFGVQQRFENVTADSSGPKRGVYRDLIGTGPFSLHLGNLHYANFYLLTFLFASDNPVTIFGQQYNLSGNAYGAVVNSSEVPEPMTLMLLATALLGSYLTKRTNFIQSTFIRSTFIRSTVSRWRL